jgi:hypothetical protein
MAMMETIRQSLGLRIRWIQNARDMKKNNITIHMNPFLDCKPTDIKMTGTFGRASVISHHDDGCHIVTIYG